MDHKSTSWPVFPSPAKEVNGRAADAGLSQEDHETQVLIERYLNLAEKFLSRVEPEIDSDSEAA